MTLSMRIDFREAIMLLVKWGPRTQQAVLSYFAPGEDRDMAAHWLQVLCAEGVIERRYAFDGEESSALYAWKENRARLFP